MTRYDDRPLRVLLVSHHYPPHLGGIENVVQHEARRLAARGAQVTVLSSGTASSVRCEDDGVRVVRIAAWNGAERLAGVPFPVLSPRLLTAALRWSRWADVVHLHDCQYPTSWAAGAAAALTRTPHLLTQHVSVVDHPSAAVLRVQHAVYALLGRPILRGARRVFTLNATVAEFVRGYGARPERAHHLPNGVDTELFRPAASADERRRARERFGLPQDTRLAVFVGRLVPKKGFDLLLEAHTGAGSGDYELVIAGSGDTTALAGHKGLHYLGALPAEELAEAYRACDVFVLPSTAEGFPLTVQEAMASGLPVVTSDDPGYRPYRLDRELLSLVPREAAALRGELAALVADDARRERMGAYSRACAERDFTWDEHASRLLHHYTDVVAAAATPRAGLTMRAPHIPRPLLEVSLLHGLLGWLYVAAVAAARPDTMSHALTTLLPIRRDTFGACCFVLSAAAALLLQVRMPDGFPGTRRPFTPGTLNAALRTVVVYSLLVWAYLCVNSLTHPQTIARQLTHFAAFPSEGQTAVACYALSALALLALRIRGARSADG